MNNIMTIVKKEFKDILRDRKTITNDFRYPNHSHAPIVYLYLFINWRYGITKRR